MDEEAALEPAPSRWEIMKANWQSRGWWLEHWLLQRLFGLRFCHSCSGYFHPACMMTPNYPDKCSQCFVREWEHMLPTDNGF